MKIRLKKHNVFLVIRALSFFMILVLLLMAVSYMLAPKDNTKSSGINNPNANGFFSEPKNSIDIAIVGNSDAYSGFSPMELWHNFGYTSYISAEGRQVVAQSLNMFKKMLTCQKPKILILETDGFYTKTDASQSFVNMLNVSMGSTFSVFQYHDRWKRVKFRDMFRKPKYTAHCGTKGQMLSNDVKGYMGGEYMIETDKIQKIPLSTIPALEGFIKVCKENNIELLLLEIPSESSWTYERHNAVQKFADDNDLTFIDLNLNRDSYGLDWTQDSRDKGNHLNSRGARKVTMYIGEYLKNNYKLTDHRKNEKYDSWNKDYENYLKEVNI